MTSPGPCRTLAAILAADVAGYSRLTGMDEEDGHRLNVHLYDDRLDCFLGSTRLLTLRRSDAMERRRMKPPLNVTRASS